MISRTLCIRALIVLLAGCNTQDRCVVEASSLDWSLEVTPERNVFPLLDGRFMSRTGEITAEQPGDPSPAPACPLRPIQDAPSGAKAGLYGFKDEKDRWAISPQFAYARDFSDGLAAVGISDESGGSPIQTCSYVDSNGRILEARFRTCGQFRRGVALVMTHEDVDLFVDLRGAPVVPGGIAASWGNQLVGISEGLLTQVSSTSGKVGFVDSRGTWVITPAFEAATDFNDGLAAVLISDDATEDPKVGFIDRAGKLVIKPRFTYSEGYYPRFSNGLARMPIEGTDPSDVYRDEFLVGYIDKTGEWAIPPIYDQRSEDFSGGLARVYSGDKSRYVDTSGRVVGPEENVD